MKRILSLLFLVCCSDSNAQLKYALKIITELSDSAMHGRGYINNGDHIAADYIAKEFEKLGAKKFKEDYFQDFKFPVNTFPDSVRVTVNGKNLTPGFDYILDPACPTNHESYELVKCSGWRSFQLVEKHGEGKGKVFVFDFGGIKDKDSLKQLNALLLKTVQQHPVIKIQDKLTWSVAGEVINFPMVEVLREKWDTAASKVSFFINNKFIEKHATRNVIGFISGKNKKKPWVVISAHYDHLGRMGNSTFFPGANDNASGTAQLLNLMKYYSENKPDFNMAFIAFAGEEAGLKGSKFYTSYPLFPLNKIRFLINLDIMGTGEEGITVVNATKHASEFELLKSVNDENDYLPLVKPRGEAANSDHYFFSQKGVPAFFIYTMGGSKAYHDVHDKASGLSFSEFEDISKLIIGFIAKLK